MARLMRAGTALAVTLGLLLAGRAEPRWHLVAVLLCCTAAAILTIARIRNPGIEALAWMAGMALASASAALIVGILLAFGADLPFEDRERLREVILYGATGVSVYGLLLYFGRGFES